MVESIIIMTDRSPVGVNSAVEVIRMGAGLVALGDTVATKVVLSGDAVLLMAKGANPAAVQQDMVESVMEMADLSDLEIGRAVVYMANQAGAKFEEPKAPAGPAAAPAGAAASAAAK